MSWVVPALLAISLLATLRLSRQPLRGKSWLLLRSLLPSWRFFEDIEPGPRLALRIKRGATYEPWQPVLRWPRRRACSLLLSPHGNLSLAYQSLVEQLWSELDGLEAARAPELTSYRLVQLVVEQQLRELGTAPVRYQFRLSQDEDDGAYVSEEHGA